MWFPRPSSLADLALHGARGLTARELFALLRDPAANEWKHKAGVAGATDGSARATTRLLESAGLIFKVDLEQGRKDQRAAMDWIDAQRALAGQLDVWHPDKRYFLLRWGGLWHPASVCPCMQTLRSESSTDARLATYTRMVAMAWRTSRDHGVGLDVNPSNFGTVERGGRLFYLDDEVYAPNGTLELGEAVAARLTEADMEPSDLEVWGAGLERMLRELGLDPVERRGVVAGIEGYPLTERWGARRRRLLEAMTESARRARTRVRRRGRLTCIFADVHANLPALEAMLASAAEAGADDYLFLGDVVGYGPHPAECVDRIAALPDTTLIRGNHDDAIGRGRPHKGMNRLAREAAEWTRNMLTEEQRDWLAELPTEHREQDWLAVHGAPRDPRRFLAYVYELTFRENLDALDQWGARVCFYGHTHVQFVHRRRLDGTKEKLGARDIDLDEHGDVLLINPGSVGQPRDGDPRAAFALWDQGTGRVVFRRAAYSVDSTVRDIRREGLPNDLTFRLETGR